MMTHHIQDRMLNNFNFGMRFSVTRCRWRGRFLTSLTACVILTAMVSFLSIFRWHRQVSVQTVGRKHPVLVQESDFMLRDNASGRLVWDVNEMQRIHIHGSQGHVRDSQRGSTNNTQRRPAVAIRQGPAAGARSGLVGFDHSLERADPRLPELTPDWLADRRAVFENRSSRLLDACRRHDVRIGRGNVTSRPGSGPLERIDSHNFVSAPMLNVTVCLLAKVASTSLLSTLLRVTGEGVPVMSGNRSSLHAVSGRLRPPRDTLAARLRDSLTVLLVRHPLRRLVSAYRDKMAQQANWPLLRHYEMLKFGVPPAAPRARLLRERELQRHRHDALRRRGVPSFGEFLAVALLGAHPLRDVHWAAYWRHCAPCHVGYRLIVQLETAADDLRYLWHALKLYHWVQIPWLHRSRPGLQEAGLQQLADTYLRLLDRQTMFAFKDEYKLDFDLFGYDWPALMRMSGHCVIDDTECDLL